MHEMGTMNDILYTVNKAAAEAGATRVLEIDLKIGAFTQIIDEALNLAFEVLSEGTLSEGAKLEVEYVSAKSKCTDCGLEFEHDIYHMECPRCGSPFTNIIAGRELTVEKIEVELPDD